MIKEIANEWLDAKDGGNKKAQAGIKPIDGKAVINGSSK